MEGFKFSLASIFLVILIAPLNVLSQRSIDPEIQKKIDDYIQNEFFPKAEIAGLGLAIVQNDGELLYTTGFGPADQEKGIENGNWTQFLIGSVTKSFTSLLVTKLLHETFPDLGEAVLDTPIRRLLPQANFTLRDRYRSEHANFRDLLAHRLCLHRGDLIYVADALRDREELTYRTRYIDEFCTMRTDMEYNNEMYVYAGELAAMLANKSYEDAIHDFLNLLGMTNTTVLKKTDDFSQMPWRAKPYYIQNGELHPMNTDLIKRLELVIPAGGIFSTPDDMTRYMRFHLNFGNLDGIQLVPKEVVEWARKPAQLMNRFNFKELDEPEKKIQSAFGYGLGLMLGSYDDWEYVYHGGYWTPYFSHMSLYPGKNLGIFSVIHTEPTRVNPDALNAAIYEILNGNPNPAEKAEKVSKQFETEKEEGKRKSQDALDRLMKEKSLSSHVNVDITGQYGHGSFGEVEVFEKFNEATNETGLYLEYGNWAHGWLVQLLPDLFRVKLTTDLWHESCAQGDCEAGLSVHFDNGTLSMLGVGIPANFTLGLRLDLLPPIPWAPDSCGK